MNLKKKSKGQSQILAVIALLAGLTVLAGTWSIVDGYLVQLRASNALGNELFNILLSLFAPGMLILIMIAFFAYLRYRPDRYY